MSRPRHPLGPWIRVILARRQRLALGALLLGLTWLAGIGLLALSGWFITATALTALAWARGLQASLEIYVPGAGIRTLALTRTLARYGERLYNHDTVLRLLADLRGVLFRDLTRRPPADRYRIRASEWLNRLVQDLDTLDTLYLRVLAPPVVTLVAVLLVLAVAVGVLGTSGWWLLTLVGLWALLVFGLAQVSRRPGEAWTRGKAELRLRAIDGIQGLPELMAWQQWSGFRRQLGADERDWRRCQDTLQIRASAGQALVTLGTQLAMLVMVVVAALAWQEGRVSGPVAVALVLMVMGLAEAFASLPGAFSRWGVIRMAAHRLNQERQGDRLPGGEQPLARAPGALSLDRVAVAYCGGLLGQGLTLTVNPGERLAVVGPSGVGKSTLVRLLTGLERPEVGRLSYQGVPFDTLNLDQWRQRLACLTQSSTLFEGTLAENLRLGHPAASDQSLWEVLAQVELADWARGLPDGLETWIGEQGRGLSGGEARRLCLARLWLRNPDWVILDEPFSDLDPSMAARIAVRLDQWLSDKGLILLTHTRYEVLTPDRVIDLARVSGE